MVSRFKKFRAKLKALGFLTAAVFWASSSTVLANPTGAQVRAGEVLVVPGVQTQIQQLTDRAIVDWQSFSIAPHEMVRFLQPSELAVILNRVVGGDPSAILGRMEANGNVFLINPNGILFGPGSVVNVGGLVASTLNISNEDFLAGRYNFSQESDQELASVVNQGTITITDGGYAVLTGPAVINEGTIVARAGKVALLAGERSTLNLDGRDLVHYTLGAEVSEGTVLLSPGTMSEAIASTLGVPLQNRANQLLRLEDGSIRLVNSSGLLVQAGTINADGKAGLDAGTVTLDSADHTLLTAESLTTASGSGPNSGGGKILVLSEMNGQVFDRGFSQVLPGALLLAGGGESGDGGFLEVSGDRLDMQGRIDLSAAGGEVGRFLLDPITTRVVNGPNVGPVTDGMTGDTIVTDGFLEAIAANFELASTGDLLFELVGVDQNINFQNFDFIFTAGTDPVDTGDIDLGQTQLLGARNLTLRADGLIDLATGIIGLDGVPAADEGHLLIQGGSVDLAGSVLNIVDGHLTIVSASNVDFGTSQVNVDPSDGADLNNPQLSVQAQTGIDFSSSVVGVAATGDLRAATADGNIMMDGGQILGAGSVSLEASQGTISLGGSSLVGADNELALVADQILLGDVAIFAQNLLNMNSDGELRLGDADIQLGGSSPGSDQMTVSAAGNIFLEQSLLEVFGQGNVRFQSTGGAIDLGTVQIDGPSVTNVDLLSFVANGDIQGGEVNIDFLGDIVMTSQEGSLTIDAGAGSAYLGTDGNATLTARENINFNGDVFIEAGRVAAFDQGKASLTAQGRQAVDVNGPVVDILGTPVVDQTTGSINLGNSTIQASQIAVSAANELQGDNVLLLATNDETGDDIDIFVKQDVMFNSLSLHSPGQIRLQADETKPETNTGSMTFNTLLVEDGTGNRALSFDLRAGNELTIRTGDIKADEVLLDNDFKSPIPVVIDGNTFFFALVTEASYGEQGGTNPDFTVEAANLNMTNGILKTFDTLINVDFNTFMDGIVVDIGESTSITSGGITELQGFELKTDFNSFITSDSLIATFEDMVLSGAMEFNDDARLQGDQKIVFDGGYIQAPEVEIALGDFVDTNDPDTGRSLVFRSHAGLAGARPTDIILTDDLDIFGTEGGFRGTPNPSRAALGDVRVQAALFDPGRPGIDLSVHAQGDIVVLDQTANVHPTAPLDHDLTVERLGEEGPGFSTSLPGIISTDGNISFLTPANLVIGKTDPARTNTDGETSMVVAESDGARIVIDALNVRDANDSTTRSIVDFDSGGFVEVVVRDSAGGSSVGDNIQIDAPEILIDADNQAGSFVSIEVMPDNRFLELLTLTSTELSALDSSTGQILRLTPGTTPLLETDLPGTALSLPDVLLVNQGTFEVGDLFFNGNLALLAEAGGSILGSANPAGTSGSSSGSLLLLADGSIGNAARSLQVRGTTVAGSGQEIFLDSTGELTVGSVQVRDSLGAVRSEDSGLVSPGTVEVQVSGSGDLILDREVSSGSGLALVTADGDLRQTSLGEISAPITALQIDGNAGQFISGLDNSEIVLLTNTLVLDVEGDALVRKNSGDLELVQSATIGGVNYQATGAGEDLRVRVDNGDLLLNADLVAGQDAALVSGLNLGVTAQTLSPFVTLNGDLTAGQNLVIRSAGDIVHVNGQLTAQQIGLGAIGSVGTPSKPVLIDTVSLALSGNGLHVSSEKDFTTVNQVQAVGVAVQGSEPVVTPPVVTPPTITPPISAQPSGPNTLLELEIPAITEPRSLSDVFAQDQVDLVEADLSELGTPFPTDAQDLALPSPVWMEDDFLSRRKFR